MKIYRKKKDEHKLQLNTEYFKNFKTSVVLRKSRVLFENSNADVHFTRVCGCVHAKRLLACRIPMRARFMGSDFKLPR